MTASQDFFISDTDADLVRRLVDSQFPQYGHLPIEYAATGWDNVMFRIGSDLAARFPRREAALDPQRNEITWLGTVARPLTTGFPEIIHVAESTHSFPYTWTITRWVHGLRAMSVAPQDRTPAAFELGRQLALLHQPAPEGAPVNPYRGLPLSSREDVLLQRIKDAPELAELLPLWSAAVAAPPPAMPRTWCHGDIHPGNYVLGADHALAALIDFGDLTSGDPAVDLGNAWASFDAQGRELFFASYLENCSPALAADPGLLPRARGWVIATTIAAVLTSDLSTPDFVRMAHWAKAQLLDDMAG
ncbi:phosphotransferase [Timonella senegalensis]|uniref:phosphotransferase n=1 Tax=Timonella senegalensis TaxID=1465825 RepID=UPI002FDF5EF6